MHATVTSNLEGIRELSKRFDVQQLGIFGSASRACGDEAVGDFDFLVDWLPETKYRRTEQYFGLWFGLQDLLEVTVKLAEHEAVMRTHWAEMISEDLVTVYDLQLQPAR